MGYEISELNLIDSIVVHFCEMTFDTFCVFAACVSCVCMCVSVCVCGGCGHV